MVQRRARVFSATVLFDSAARGLKSGNSSDNKNKCRDLVELTSHDLYSKSDISKIKDT